MSKTVYRIRRKTDGLFSTGGWNPVFRKEGKSWASAGAIRIHFSNLDKQHRNQIYQNCEVVAYQVTETESETVNYSDWNSPRMKQEPSDQFIL